MDSYLLTINDCLPHLNTYSTSSIKLDVTDNNVKFSIETSSKTSHDGSLETVTTYNNTENNQLRKKQEPTEKSETPPKKQEIQDNTKPEKKENSKPNKDDSLSNVEYKGTVDSILKEIKGSIEQKGESKLAKLLYSTKENKALSISEKIIESAENKKLIPNDKIHKELKSFLLRESKDQNAVNTNIKNIFVKKVENGVTGEVKNSKKLSLQNESGI